MNTIPYPLKDELAAFFPMLGKLVQTLEAGVKKRLYAFATLEDLDQFQSNVSRTETSSITADRGLVLRILAGHRNFEYATNCFDEAVLLKEAETLRKEALAYLDQQTAPAVYTPLGWSEEPLDAFAEPVRAQILSGGSLPTAQTPVHFGSAYDPSMSESLSKTETTQRSRALKEAIEKAGGDQLASAGTMIRRKVKSRLFVDRTRMMSQSLFSSLYYLYAVTPSGKTVRDIVGGMAGAEAAISIDDAVVAKLVETAVKLENAPHIQPGRYRIISGPDVTGVIAHEAFGHTQEGDTCRLGRSCAPGLRKKGTLVGNEQASIINNAGVFSMGKTPYGVNGTHFFDDEGFIARPQVILDKGVLSSPMNDLISSLVGDINGPAARQSNGKRESWKRPLMPRQTNTYFTAGDKTLDELAELCGDGFIAEHAHGGMEDPKGMGLTAGTEYLEEVKGGKRTGNLFLGPQGGHVELSDPVPRLLQSIIAKSTIEADGTPDQGEPHNKWGGCGKYHKEGVEAGCGGPWILWEGITCG
ncbi:metallopeptidase TldD-related protein [Pontiella sulfatireligans]|uniref:Metalloprotease TldD n=1 Tax=Pontiella sulfatireligans TaxID=2750658 RepID=A0A6C2UND0_9BACT|nr:metallopeptidase TldD-related protein [Pontiella sulfatireligans]VGO21569.1 Metalloprotease TldD [Pontiella sulfatireligans]